ncbi:flavodoxin domain-containing protein [Kibdelosporangium lantanae]
MTTVLVAYATKMGSTGEIAQRIGRAIEAAGYEVSVLPARDVPDVDSYDAVVVGSALYARRWRREAVRFLTRHRTALGTRMLWLFHSGPCGPDADAPQPTPANVRRLTGALAITFGGRLDPATAQGFLARRMATGPLAGDFRDWDRIDAWATEIVATLHKEGTHAPH